MAKPRRTVAPAELDAVEDVDARDNYRIVLAFRDRLLDSGTVEGCYMSLFKKAPVSIPPLFIEQMVHVILRSLLDGCEDALRLRAAELFFREQKATIQEGHALLADLETVEMHASGHRYGSIGRLIVECWNRSFKDPESIPSRRVGDPRHQWDHRSAINGKIGSIALPVVSESLEDPMMNLPDQVDPALRIDQPRVRFP